MLDGDRAVGGRPGEDAINLRQLRYFVTVVETGNITRAARDLNVSQPSLGVQIRLLEEELGTALLARHSRGITVTAAGVLLAAKARDILHQVDNLAGEVRGLSSSGRRKLVLGLPPSIIKLIGHDLILHVEADMPEVALSLVEERSVTLIKAMERDEVDLALAYEIEERTDLIRRVVLEEDLVFVTSPALAPPGGVIALKDALSSDLAIAGGRGLMRRLVEREAERLSLRLNPAFEIHSITSLHLLLEEGRASGIMPYGLAAEHAARGTLVCSRIESPVKRVLYIERPSWRGLPIEDGTFENLIEWMATRLIQTLGPYARRLPLA